MRISPIRDIFSGLINRRNPAQDITKFGTPSLMQDEDEDDDTFKARTEAFERLSQLIAQAPQRKEPGIGRRIVAGLAALKDPARAEEIKYGGYNNQVKDWLVRAQQAKGLADIENDRNTNDRILHNQEAQQRRDTRRLDETERAARERERINQEKLDEAKRVNDAKIKKDEKMLAIREATQNNPNYEKSIDKDGFVIYINKKNPKDIIKTDIDTTDLSEREKFQLGLRKSLSEIEARHENTLEEIEARGEESRETNLERAAVSAVTPNRSSNKPPTPSAEKTARINRAIEVTSQFPELAKYIDIKTGQVKPAGMFSTDAGKANRQRALELMQGNTNLTQSTIPSKSEEMVKKQRNRATGAERTVYSYDGGKTWVTERKNK